MNLSAAHHEALDRRRRMVVQYDANANLGGDFAQWLDYRFDYVDSSGVQIDSLWWDIGGGSYATYPSRVLPPTEDVGLLRWQAQGIEWVGELVAQTRRRGLECFWNHRISEVDVRPEGGLDVERLHPLKAQHPDWVIKSWWWQGLWNLASAGLREHTVAVLRELAERYDLDGFQLDFARHVPCLPPGRQWELRDEATQFVRMVREMLQEVAAARGRPYLLAARVPRTPEGCVLDGLDVGTWAAEGLVDILSLGSRSMEVDIEGFRRLIAGRHIKLQPCLDDHHSPDAYQYPPIQHFRGVFTNWWSQGADSVMTFNWSNAPADKCRQVGALPGPQSHLEAYRECGSPQSMWLLDKRFVVQRRGGYPWAEGYFNRNDDAPLPVTLRNDGRAAELDLRVHEPVASLAEQVASVAVRLVLFGVREGDELEACLNGGLPLAELERDDRWKDKQIFSPAPQPASGGADHWKVNPDQRLLRLEFSAEPRTLHRGWNRLHVTIRSRQPFLPMQDIVLEKVEVDVKYDR